MAVTAFKLPSAPKNEEAEEKSRFTPIDTEHLPTKEMAETFHALVELNKQRKLIEDRLEDLLLPYIEGNCPEGMTTVFGFRYNSIAFNFVPPRKTKGKLVLEAPTVKKAK